MSYFQSCYTLRATIPQDGSIIQSWNDQVGHHCINKTVVLGPLSYLPTTPVSDKKFI